MDNTSSKSATIPVLRRGLRRYDIKNKDFILIFIHDLQSWSISKLWEFLSKRISNCNEIVHGITKKTHTPNMENYFILRINYDKPTYYLNIFYFFLPIAFQSIKLIGSKPAKSELSVKLRNLTTNFLLLF